MHPELEEGPAADPRAMRRPAPPARLASRPVPLAPACVSRGTSDGTSPRAVLTTPLLNCPWFMAGTTAKGRLAANRLRRRAARAGRQGWAAQHSGLAVAARALHVSQGCPQAHAPTWRQSGRPGWPGALRSSPRASRAAGRPALPARASAGAARRWRPPPAADGQASKWLSNAEAQDWRLPRQAILSAPRARAWARRQGEASPSKSCRRPRQPA